MNRAPAVADRASALAPEAAAARAADADRAPRPAPAPVRAGVRFRA
jgi:hypothetical protein